MYGDVSAVIIIAMAYICPQAVQREASSNGSHLHD